MATGTARLHNRLLNLLPAVEWLRWQPLLEVVELAAGEMLCKAGDDASQVYFPDAAIVSLLYTTENGATAEIAAVGNEGFIGAHLLMGGETFPNRALVRRAGSAYRLSARYVRAEFSASSAVMHLLLRYTQALITQMAQTAVCHRQHAVDQQLCRWLLLNLDRLEPEVMLVAADRIAGMLGLQREAVAGSALRLQSLKLISYARNRIAVLDRSGMEQQSCECYAAVKSEYDRLLPLAKAA